MNHPSEVALEKYISRSREALKLFKEQRTEDALRQLRLAKAAFYNFKTSDYLAHIKFDETKHDKMVEVYQIISVINQEIEVVLTKIRNDHLLQLQKIRKEKASIQKFRSQAQSASTFQQNV